MLKNKKVGNTTKFTIQPKVAMLINRAKANSQEYRILIQGEDEQDVKVSNRVTIVVNQSGNFIKNYYG